MGCICSTDDNKNLSKNMLERKSRLFETASILGEEIKNFEDIKMCGLLDMSKDDEQQYKHHKEKVLTIAHYAVASMRQMFPPTLYLHVRDKYKYIHPQHFIPSSIKRLMDRDSYGGQRLSNYKCSDKKRNEILKYLIPCKSNNPLSFKFFEDMTFQTNDFLILNGLKFYPTSTTPEEQGQQIVRFKSDGLIINSRNDELIAQLKEALAKNEQAADELYQNEAAELTEGGVLFGERRIIEKQLKIEMDRKIDKKVYLTLDIPVGWSCVADCYWVNLSIINQQQS